MLCPIFIYINWELVPKHDTKYNILQLIASYLFYLRSKLLQWATNIIMAITHHCHDLTPVWYRLFCMWPLDIQFFFGGKKVPTFFNRSVNTKLNCRLLTRFKPNWHTHTNRKYQNHVKKPNSRESAWGAVFPCNHYQFSRACKITKIVFLTKHICYQMMNPKVVPAVLVLCTHQDNLIANVEVWD